MATCSFRWLGHVLVLSVSLTAVAVGPPAQADITYNVTFDDPGQANAVWYDRITSHTLAAGADWARHIGGDAELDVIVRFPTDIPRGGGRSMTNAFLRNNGSYDIFQDSAIFELRTGVDINGSAPDIELVFNPNYLANDVWFDPDPYSRTTTIEGNRVDAVSVFLHELGHAFGFNGWRNAFDGVLPTNPVVNEQYASTFDDLTIFDGTDFYFIGTLAQAVYGGPVPLTYGNIFHLGNRSPRPGADLIPGVMNGVVFEWRNRYEISALDVAILRDVGVPAAPAAVPEPGSLLLTSLVGLGSVGIWFGRRRKSKPAA